ncbi:MAG: threonine synthase [Acidobacteriia bacterium]|nr:threonine synthase [Terriglobia bacterium]
MYLRCSNPDCAARVEGEDRALLCPRCGDLLELALGVPLLDPEVLKRMWLERRCSFDPRDGSGVWRFREFLPGPYAPNEVVTLGEGNVPLVPAGKTASWCGLKALSFKHLGWNPTGCFKDLGMTVGITDAKHRGAREVACASTGNTAASMAAYAARAGIRARVYLPAGAVSHNKLAQSLDYGAEIQEVEGNFDRALQVVLAGAGPEMYFLNSINPYRIEGQKTAIFSLLEQLQWRPPDYIVLPGGNLGNTAAFGKALAELKANGFIEIVPRLIVIQAEGANPLARAWKNKSEELQPMAEPETEATAIRIGSPRSWNKALRALHFTDGLVADVSDEEISDAKAMIGRDGIGCEPASATTLAGLRKLRCRGVLGSDAVVVAMLTGHALKDTDYISRRHATVQVAAGVCVAPRMERAVQWK